jgi:Flp pilus assembly pilin Flp
MRFFGKRGEQGVAMLEMALTIMLIAIIAITAIRINGRNLSRRYQNTAYCVGDSSNYCSADAGSGCGGTLCGI